MLDASSTAFGSPKHVSRIAMAFLYNAIASVGRPRAFATHARSSITMATSKWFGPKALIFSSWRCSYNLAASANFPWVLHSHAILFNNTDICGCPGGWLARNTRSEFLHDCSAAPNLFFCSEENKERGQCAMMFSQLRKKKRVYLLCFVATNLFREDCTAAKLL